MITLSPEHRGQFSFSSMNDSRRNLLDGGDYHPPVHPDDFSSRASPENLFLCRLFRFAQTRQWPFYLHAPR
jgi:hypothetical protein